MNVNDKLAARRKLLKTATIGGGVVVTAAALPSTWTKPVLSAVISPAHAQMSEGMEDMPITGVFTASDLQGDGPSALTNNQVLLPKGIQYTILNTLIPAAHANLTVRSSVCGNNDGPPSFSFDLVIQINVDGGVDFAIDGGFIGQASDSSIICSGSSSITDTTIADASINIGNSDGRDCFIDVSGMTASESEVTGTWAFNANGNGDGLVPCSGSFTAPLSGAFPTAESCEGINLFAVD